LINLLKVKLYKNFNLKVAIFDSSTFNSIIKLVNNDEELSSTQFKFVESLESIYPNKFNVDLFLGTLIIIRINPLLIGFLDLISPDESNCVLCNKKCNIPEVILLNIN
jgi:hypothetical protein